MALNICLAQSDEPFHLCRGYRFPRCAEGGASSGAYLDEDEEIVLLGDDIDLALATAKIKLGTPGASERAASIALEMMKTCN